MTTIFTFDSMFSKQEASQLRQEFWTAFGLYMQPLKSSEGERVNWVNYKTGEKSVYFRMQAESTFAFIGIEMSHQEPGIQELYFEQFKELRSLLESQTGEVWIWNLQMKDDYGKTVSRIYKKIDHVSIYKKSDWPQLISFFKPRLIALDAFWNQVKYGFEALR
ncbi:MAG TPA: DUF4268 domain-containing protein [Flavisolibacter sp.]|nr:DUF4268 domain-containing protein [Flavisolibacter sp.]